MSRFMEVKSINPNFTQRQIAKDLGYFDSTSKRYRNDKKSKVLIAPLRSKLNSKNSKDLIMSCEAFKRVSFGTRD